jgi:arsenite methyltransferase
MLLEEAGFVDVEIGPAVDTFAGARGEEKARTYAVFGHPFRARRP